VHPAKLSLMKTRSTAACFAALLAASAMLAPPSAAAGPSPACEPPQSSVIEVRQRKVPVDTAAPAFDMEFVPVRADSELDPWFRTQPASVPAFARVRQVHPFDTFLPLVTMRGIGAGADGNGHVSLDVTVVSADGETEVIAEDVVAWDGPLPAPSIAVLCQTRFAMGWDEKEALGTLTVIVEAHDEASGATVRRDAQIELVPWTYGDTPADADALNDWFTFYYRAPHPGEAVRAYLECASLANVDSPSWNFANLGFFRAVFADKPWLVDGLVGRVTEDVSGDQLLKVCVLLHLLGQDERIDSLPIGAERCAAARAAVSKVPDFDPYAEITRPEQLDLPWGEFLATGRYAPARQLVTALRLSGYAEAVDSYKDSAKTEADTEALFKGLTFRAAVWSINSNMGQHPLLVDYGVWMLAHGELGSEEERVTLGMMLAKHAPELVRIRKKGDPEDWPASDAAR
jgi:hypothetical protein